MRQVRKVVHEGRFTVTFWEVRLVQDEGGGSRSLTYAADVEIEGPVVGRLPGDPAELVSLGGEVRDLDPGAGLAADGLAMVKVIRVQSANRLSRAKVHECVALAVGRMADAQLRSANLLHRALGVTRAKQHIRFDLDLALDAAAKVFGNAVVP
ncbi:MAG: hypothetical protein IPM35_04210 [Myxococcales bacterium]|nr:hypothetical protein [Myxococcales bacterium]